MMKVFSRFTVVVLVALLIVAIVFFFVWYALFVDVQKSHASNKLNIPSTYNCITNLCNSHLYWYGQQHGGTTQFNVSNPNLSASNADYYRYMSITNSTINIDSFFVGIEKFKGGNATYCKGYASNVLYYFRKWTRNLVQQSLTCDIVPSGDIGNVTIFKEGYFTQGGGGTFIQIQNASHNQPCYNGCFYDGADQIYQDINFDETMEDNTTGHEVWGVHWQYNQYQSITDSNWDYIQGPARGCTPDNGAGCPIEFGKVLMYWNVYPHDSTTGGQLYSCVYETGSICFIGG